jgi:hypothetical protein
MRAAVDGFDQGADFAEGLRRAMNSTQTPRCSCRLPRSDACANEAAALIRQIERGSYAWRHLLNGPIFGHERDLQYEDCEEAMLAEV